MVKNNVADPKNNHIAKNDMGMGKYSLRYHIHKISRFCAKKMINGTHKKGCFIEAKLLSHKER